MATQDGYELYYTEKLWNWIPGFYREEDAYTDTPGTLREIIEDMGEQSAELRRTLDRLWENSFVELADDHALVKLGELVATRMVHVLNRRARRVDVARTIYYRRRKGTPWVLERLINDIAGWTGSHLDTRRRLARTYHLLEPRPELLPVTLTPRGGWANLRSPRIPALAFTAFEELSHTPDFRRHYGHEGRYGIPKIGVHVHRMRAMKIEFPTVAVLDSASSPPKFALDPSGRAVPLFQPADRPSGDSWTRPREWQMPRVIERRLLAHAEYEWTDATIDALAVGPTVNARTLLKRYSGWRVRSNVELERLINSFPAVDAASIDVAELKAAALVADCGSARLYGTALALDVAADNDDPPNLSRQQVLVANLSEWGTNLDASLLTDHVAIIDPVTGAAISSTAVDTNKLIAPILHYGAPSELGAGPYDRRASVETVGVTQLDGGGDLVGPIGLTPTGTTAVDEIINSKTYTPAAISGVEDYRLQAASLERPYLLISDDDATWTITAAAKGPGDVRKLVLDGLWIGVEDADATYPLVLVNADDPAPTVLGKLVLAGTWDRVEIRHCTLDPGGEKIRTAPTECVPIPYVSLQIDGYVEELIIESSILGPIVENNEDLSPCSAGKVTIRDSIVINPESGPVEAISTKLAEVHIERSTIIGNVTVNRLYASDTLITGAGTIADLQHGCFRFSAGVEGKWPHPFEHFDFPEFEDAWIETTTFGQPSYMRITELAPIELRTGAENHCEMGVYNRLIEPIKLADLRAKLEEFMPFDLIEQIDLEN